MGKFGLRFAVWLAAVLFSGAAFAACSTTTAKDDLEDQEIQALYECIQSQMREGYAKGDNAWAKDYHINWKAASTQPAAPGFHGGRFLMTFVNDTGHAEYIKFEEERGPMPVGSLIAKESFNVSKKGEVKVGPLFFMEKVAAGTADEFGNWVYSAVTPGGKAMGIKQSFCHDCHNNYAEQDALGYPVEDYRVSAQ